MRGKWPAQCRSTLKIRLAQHPKIGSRRLRQHLQQQPCEAVLGDLAGEELGHQLLMNIAAGQHRILDGFREIPEHGLLRGVVLHLGHDAFVFPYLVGNGVGVVDEVLVAQLFGGEEVVQPGDDP